MITDDIFLELHRILPRFADEQVYLITDENVAHHCLPRFMEQIADFGTLYLNTLQRHTLVLPAGEGEKNLQTVCKIWDWLQAEGATRKSIVLLLGGGVVTDMAGFAAACYQRGIAFVNIPTTLLSIVDASDGGKTGIDYGGLKNQVGLFRPALETIIWLPFLRSLPAEEFLSGWAEMIKHALIASPLEWNRLLAFDLEQYMTRPDEALEEEFRAILMRSMDIKRYVVEQDPEEQDVRRVLNLGHTVGHALESILIERGEPRPHGYCVLWGMVAELYLSHVALGFPEAVLSQLSRYMKDYYGAPGFTCKDYDKAPGAHAARQEEYRRSHQFHPAAPHRQSRSGKPRDGRRDTRGAGLLVLALSAASPNIYSTRIHEREERHHSPCYVTHGIRERTVRITAYRSGRRALSRFVGQRRAG